jgi:glycosyltransferase involved in cell wall biosynthesis
MSKTVFVHDNFVQAGGGERVAEEMARCLPEADMVSTVTVEERLSSYVKQRGVKTTWLQRFPGMKRFYRHYFLFYPFAARSLDLSGYDKIISSCYGFAKMVQKPQGAIHICYCHTPTRWIWRADDYFGRENFGKTMRSVLNFIISRMKKVDLDAANQVDFFIANSQVVKERIRKYYGRDSIVICPPIQLHRFETSEDVEDYYLVLSRLVAYKRIELAVQACERLHRKLKIVGHGPDRKRLEQLAGKHTEFLGRLSDAESTRLLSRCRALIFPGEEDFGLTPLEAGASGRPTVAYGAGGALDTVVPGLNGVHFSEPTADSLVDGIHRLEAGNWDSVAIRQHAEKFSVESFANQFNDVVQRLSSRRAGGANTLDRHAQSDSHVPVPSRKWRAEGVL